MLQDEDINRLFADGPSLADYLPYAEEVDGVLLNVDGSLGRVWQIGSRDVELACEEEREKFSLGLAAFIGTLPPEMHAQMILWGSDDIEPSLERYRSFGCAQDSQVAGAALESRLAFMLALAQNGQQTGQLKVRRIRLIFSVRVFPSWRNVPGGVKAEAFFCDTRQVSRVISLQWQEHKEAFLRQARQIENSLRSLGLGCVCLQEKDITALLYKMLNPRRARNVPAPVRDQGFIRDQLLFSPVKIAPEGLRLDGSILRLVTIKELPAQTFAGMLLAGYRGGFWDELGDMAMVFNFVVPDQSRALAKLKAQKAFAFIRRSSSLGDVSEEAVGKKEELSAVISRLFQGGQSVLESRIHFVCASVDEQESLRQAEHIIHFLGRSGIQAVREDAIGSSLFLTCLPLNYDHRREPFIRRKRRMLSDNLADMLPLYGAFQGTGTPAALYLNRRGEPVFLDLFDSDTNPHAVIIGASGAGKSFFTNDFIHQNYRTGAHFFVLDKGHSYRKTCEVLGGSYVSLDMSSPVLINPFARTLQSEGLAFLVDMLALMASGGDERDRLSREEKGVLHLAVLEAYARHNQNSSRELVLSDVVAVLEDPAACFAGVSGADMAFRLALRLIPYTRRGQYGAFFDGQSQFVPGGRFTVFELAQISRYPDLQLVALLNIMFLITGFVSDEDLRGKNKFLIIDEAWQLLKTSSTADFISAAFKTFRKYRCAAVAVTQETADLLQQPAGLAILANSAHKIFLRQESGIIERLCRELAFSPQTGELLRSLVTVRGRYSEALVLVGPGGGVIRLAPDPFLYWAATSDARENEFLDEIRRQQEGNLTRALMVCAGKMPHGLR